MQAVQYRPLALLGAIWGVLGIAALLGSAIYRLAQIALEAFDVELAWYHWAVLILNILFMAYSEGYRGFQKGFSPRVVARARFLSQQSKPLWWLLAPFFCAGYFAASTRTKTTVFLVTTAIIVVVRLVHYLPQPWRGILDAGVVVGLCWGVLSLLASCVVAIRSPQALPAHDVPLTAGGLHIS